MKQLTANRWGVITGIVALFLSGISVLISLNNASYTKAQLDIAIFDRTPKPQLDSAVFDEGNDRYLAITMSNGGAPFTIAFSGFTIQDPNSDGIGYNYWQRRDLEDDFPIRVDRYDSWTIRIDHKEWRNLDRKKKESVTGYMVGTSIGPYHVSDETWNKFTI